MNILKKQISSTHQLVIDIPSSELKLYLTFLCLLCMEVSNVSDQSSLSLVQQPIPYDFTIVSISTALTGCGDTQKVHDICVVAGMHPTDLVIVSGVPFCRVFFNNHVE